jgi:hypothetical protein
MDANVECKLCLILLSFCALRRAEFAACMVNGWLSLGEALPFSVDVHRFEPGRPA